MRKEIGCLPNWLGSSESPKIAKKLGSIKGGEVLDVATGRGGFIDTLMNILKDYESFIGIDNCTYHDSAKEMKEGREHFKDRPVEFAKMNGEHLGFRDCSFDTVCISYSLHHIDRVDAVLAEMKRVLRPGGWFIIQELYCDGDKTEAQMVDELDHEWCARIDRLLGMTHNKAFTKQKLMDYANGLNLANLDIFDSDRPVDCLFCEKNQLCENPRNQANFHDLARRVDETYDRIKDYPDPDVRNRIKEEGEMIKKAIARAGSAPAPYLFMVGIG